MPKNVTIRDFIVADSRHHVRPETVVRVSSSTKAMDAITNAQARGAIYLIVEKDGDDRLLMLDSEALVETWRKLGPDSTKTIGQLARREALRVPEVSLDTPVVDVAWAKAANWNAGGMAILRTDGEFNGLVTQNEIGRDFLNGALPLYQCASKLCLFYPPAVPTICKKHGALVARL